MRRFVRCLGIVVVGLLVVASGMAAAQDKPQDKTDTTVAADPLTGDWDGTVDTPNSAVSFVLKVKLEKDKVSGEIASAEGGTTVSGTFTDAKLSVTFVYNGTDVSMTGTLKDGALSGEMNFGGQAMPYTAKKRKA